jgi:hypothetical protein
MSGKQLKHAVLLPRLGSRIILEMFRRKARASVISRAGGLLVLV